MKHYLYIKTKVRNKGKLLVKLYKHNINVYDVYDNSEYVFLKVKKEDLEKIKKEIVTIKFTFVRESGLYHLFEMMNPLKIMIVVLFLLLIHLSSYVIVSVDVIHSNKEIRELVENALEDKGINRFSIKKEYDELQKIKENILDLNKDNLEWIEIESVGMKYIVRIEDRIKKQEDTPKNTCHIVATKSGIVENIISTKGEIMVREGQYVSEGDILISGEIKFNEEVKNNVCAEGEVYAEVWYTTSVSLPIRYTNHVRTGKKRINFSFDTGGKKYKIFRSRLENYESVDKKIFRFLNFTFYKTIEYEIVEDTEEYNEKTGEEEILRLSDEKIKAMLDKNESIKLRKVLKKSINNSTIEMEVFYAVIEDISTSKDYQIEELEEE